MKGKQTFERPFIGTSQYEDVTLLYSPNGNYSSVFKMENFAQQLGADTELYLNQHNLLGEIIKKIGPEYILQKTDIISKQKFDQTTISEDYLSRKYFENFQGREYNKIETYLTITRETKKKGMYGFSEIEVKEFITKIKKVEDTILVNGGKTKVLNERELNAFFARYMAFDFNNKEFSYSNIQADAKGLDFGNLRLQIISLIDIDELNIPNNISTYKVDKSIGVDFPADNFTFLFDCPNVETILYNQVVFIPDQMKVKKDLELKKKRHSSMPDASNQISVEDIESMFLDIAGDNELLVYSHFSIMVFADKTKIDKAINFLETSLFGLGIIPGKNTYNQMELFRGGIPGNAHEIKMYDKFLTSRPASICFFFKESLPLSEKSKYLLYYTDRQGIPVGIDTSELPMETNRISNRNKFILGPSGSGKSFFTNSYVKQIICNEADVVIVDTGNSYLGLCKYFKGKYITYKESEPITMNPFNIQKDENKEEKRQTLKTLIALIWKGVEGKVSVVEDSVLNNCVKLYFDDYFGAKEKVKVLKFDSFYEYSIVKINEIIKGDKIKFNVDEYKYVLKKFYKGGEYETILNDDFDNTLFNETFIVFEIDNIKEHKLLFPITTLIIMDVFMQKMKYKKNKKVLIIEEAWKAIASPMMVGFIQYLYKTIRKYGGEAILVTQELNDIIGNTVLKDSVIVNSDTICLLDQAKNKDTFEGIAEVLSINLIERNKIFTINKLNNKDGRGRFKEVYIRRGTVGEVYGVEVPFEEYLTYTTESKEREAIETYLHNFPASYEEAIEGMVKDLKSSELTLLEFCKVVNKKSKIYYA